MSDPLLAIVLIPLFLSILAAASWFKTLDSALVREGHVPLLAGIAIGLLLRFLDRPPLPFPVLAGLLFTAAALYVRHTGQESEPIAGMMLGALTGAGTAALFALNADALIRFAQYVPAAAVAGYGITFGISHLRDRLRQLAFDALTAALAIGAVWLPLLLQDRVPPRQLALGAAALVPLLAVAAAVWQWPRVANELREEASHGLINPADVRTASHPLLRLGRSGWHSGSAHREFVRIATRLALRKRQQRDRPEKIARLYQLEVIKLRMEMQQMVRVDRAMRSAAETEEAVVGQG